MASIGALKCYICPKRQDYLAVYKIFYVNETYVLTKNYKIQTIVNEKVALHWKEV